MRHQSVSFYDSHSCVMVVRYQHKGSFGTVRGQCLCQTKDKSDLWQVKRVCPCPFVDKYGSGS